MKKLTVLMLIAVWIFIYSPVAGAWEVSLYNGTRVPVKFEIYGEHLFWEQIECTQTVASGKYGTCVMPGGICPSSAQFTYWYERTKDTRVVKTTRFAICMRRTASVTEDVNGWFDWHFD